MLELIEAYTRLSGTLILQVQSVGRGYGLICPGKSKFGDVMYPFSADDNIVSLEQLAIEKKY